MNGLTIAMKYMTTNDRLLQVLSSYSGRSRKLSEGLQVKFVFLNPLVKKDASQMTIINKCISKTLDVY
jgi:hypothetical protein